VSVTFVQGRNQKVGRFLPSLPTIFFLSFPSSPSLTPLSLTAKWSLKYSYDSWKKRRPTGVTTFAAARHTSGALDMIHQK